MTNYEKIGERMAGTEFQQYDVVSLTADLEPYGFTAGTQGTIVEVLAPSVFMVEFDADTELVLPAVGPEQLKLEWRRESRK